MLISGVCTLGKKKERMEKIALEKFNGVKNGRKRGLRIRMCKALPTERVQNVSMLMPYFSGSPLRIWKLNS